MLILTVTHTDTLTQSRTYTHVCPFARICTRTYARIHTHTLTHSHTHMCTHKCMNTCSNIYDILNEEVISKILRNNSYNYRIQLQ